MEQEIDFANYSDGVVEIEVLNFKYPRRSYEILFEYNESRFSLFLSPSQFEKLKELMKND